MLCGYITLFGVTADHQMASSGDPQPPQIQWYCHTAHQTHIRPPKFEVESIICCPPMDLFETITLKGINIFIIHTSSKYI